MLYNNNEPASAPPLQDFNGFESQMEMVDNARADLQSTQLGLGPAVPESEVRDSEMESSDHTANAIQQLQADTAGEYVAAD